MSNSINKSLKIESLNEKLSLIKPNDSKAKSEWKHVIENIGGGWKVNKGGWVIATHKIKELREIENEFFNKNEDDEKSPRKNKNTEKDEKDDDEDEYYEDSDETSTDDEMVQKVLARRLKSESTQDEIPETNISDSENEDVLSVCRRLRHLYREMNILKSEIQQLKRLQ